MIDQAQVELELKEEFINELDECVKGLNEVTEKANTYRQRITLLQGGLNALELIKKKKAEA